MSLRLETGGCVRMQQGGNSGDAGGSIKMPVSQLINTSVTQSRQTPPCTQLLLVQMHRVAQKVSQYHASSLNRMKARR